MNIIETKNVDRVFDLAGGEKLYALRDISVGIPAGALTILKGPSGSGKTTLMNIIGALDAPSAGSVLLEGRETAGMTEDEKGMIRRKRFGFVFQSVSLIPIMTVYENVEFALRLSGYDGDPAERVNKCLRLVGLLARADHMPQELSGGEQQRVAIARAIAHRPGVVFADEPTAELDSQTAVSVVNIFRELVQEEGITVVMTTHDTGLMEAGDRIYTLEDGHITDMRENPRETAGPGNGD